MAEQPTEKITRLKEELQAVETELEEATSMRAEAQGLGEDDVIAELAQVEERLQAEILELKAELLAAQSEASAAASAALRARMAKLRQSALSRSRSARASAELPSDLPTQPSGTSLASQPSASSIDADSAPGRASDVGERRASAAWSESGRGGSPRRSTFSVADMTPAEMTVPPDGRQEQRAEPVSEPNFAAQAAQASNRGLEGKTLQQLAAEAMSQPAAERQEPADSSAGRVASSPSRHRNEPAQQQVDSDLQSSPPAMAALSAKLPTDAFNAETDAWKGADRLGNKSASPGHGGEVSTSVRVDAFPPAQHAASNGSRAAEDLSQRTSPDSSAEKQQQSAKHAETAAQPPQHHQSASDAWSSFDNGPEQSTAPSQPADDTFSPTKAGFSDLSASQQQPEAALEDPSPADSAPSDPASASAIATGREVSTSYTEAVINSAAAAAKGVAVALGMSDAAADSIDSTTDTVVQALDPVPVASAGSDTTAPVPATASPLQKLETQADPEARSGPSQEPAILEAPPAASSATPGKDLGSEIEQPAGAQALSELPPVVTRAVRAADTASPKSQPSRSSSPGGRGSPSKYRHASSKALPVSRSKPGTPATSQPGSPARSQSPQKAATPLSALNTPVSAPPSPFSLHAQGSSGSLSEAKGALEQPGAESSAPGTHTHSAATAEADAMEAGLPQQQQQQQQQQRDQQQQQQQQQHEMAASQGGADDDAWSSFDTQADPTTQHSLPTRETPPPPPMAPESEVWPLPEASSADAIQHAWSGNPFMDFKLSGGLASTQSAHSQEPDPFSGGFTVPQQELPAAVASPWHEPTTSVDAWDAPVATHASHERTFDFGEDAPADRAAASQQPAASTFSAHAGAASAHDPSVNDSGAVQPCKPAEQWADAMWGDAFSSHSQQQSSTSDLSAPPPANTAGTPPPQQTESPAKEQAPKLSFATSDAWADFGSSKSMLSLDRGAFGAPKQASGSLLNVSLPSKQNQGAWGFEDLQPAASGTSWDDSPAGSREPSPQRSIPSRHSQRAEDNPFEADLDSAPASQPETSQPSATSSSQSKLGKRLASIKQMNTSMNKSAKQMLKSDNVRKLQDAMKVKWRGRTTTEEDPTPDVSAPESELTSRGTSDVSGAWASEGPRTSTSSFEPQDSLSKALGLDLPRQHQPASMSQWPDITGASGVQQAEDPVLAWRPLSSAVKQKCQAAFKAQGLDTEDAGMQSDEAMVLFMRIKPAPACGFRTLFTWCDLGSDGKLNEQEFCLFMYMLKAPEHTASLPSKLTPTQVAHVLDEPAPASSRDGSPDRSAASQAPSHLSPWLQPLGTGSDAVDSLAGQEQLDQGASATTPELRTLMGKGYQEDDCKRALFLHANDVKPALEWLQERFGRLHSSEPSSDLTSSLSIATRLPDVQASAPKGFEFRADPASPPGSRGPRLQILVERADVPHYKKALDGPFFALALRDGNGALLESELATPPGHLDREAGCIAAGHAITFRTPIMDIPEGAALFFEVRHYKMQERRLSTLAWSFIPVEVFILHHHQSSGSPMSPRLSGPKVRTGPMFLSLYHKPTDERIHARSHLHHAAAIARRGPKPIGKVHDLFISVLVA